MLPEMTKVPGFMNNTYMKRLLSQGKNRNDGKTNRNGMNLVLRIKSYLADSFSLVVGMISLCELMESVPDTWEEKHVFQETNKYVYQRMTRIIRRMTQSLIEQRKLFDMVKNIISVNEVPQTWFTYLSREITSVENRLITIENILKEDLKTTPFIMYIQWLDENESTFTKDMRSIISKDNFKSMFGCDYNAVHDVIRDHISSIILEGQDNEELRKKAVEEADRYAAVVEKRKEARRKEKEDRKQKIVESKKEELKEILYNATSNINLLYKRSCSKDELYNIAKKNGVFYVVVTMKVSKNILDINRTVYYATGKYLTSDVLRAKKYHFKEDAEARYKELLEKHPEYISEVVLVDIRGMAAEIGLPA